ncbi:hypothetical protein [Anabaena sp. PCC 7108]|uniref:hypothetical protein n=1 Tax=Anabaena sp. PCC 7108 TaxID=163908 RepID=UPI00034DE6AA|nr:hypothetical protein [Anabaena sp. PCC 7108]
MSSVTQNTSSNSGLDLIFFTIPQSCLLQLSTVPLLMLLIADKASSKALASVGEASEEVFRGDRLPNLTFPDE